MIQLNQKQIYIGIGILVIMLVVIGYYFYTTLQKKEEETILIKEENEVQRQEEATQEDDEQIIVHIAGEVKNPGIIKTNEGARIADIIRRSWGAKRRSRYSRH